MQMLIAMVTRANSWNAIFVNTRCSYSNQFISNPCKKKTKKHFTPWINPIDTYLKVIKSFKQAQGVCINSSSMFLACHMSMKWSRYICTSTYCFKIITYKCLFWWHINPCTLSSHPDIIHYKHLTTNTRYTNTRLKKNSLAELCSHCLEDQNFRDLVSQLACIHNASDVWYMYHTYSLSHVLNATTWSKWLPYHIIL